MVETLPGIMYYVEQYAEHIGGQYTDYDHTKSVIVVPLSTSRFQTVLASVQTSPVSGREQALFTSKVCEFRADLDLKALLERNASFDYSKFIIEDGYVKVEASCLSETVSEEQVREMIQEVAQLADHYEMKHTGRDIH
ncbi:YbjN domain-containing protein [Ohtaekwangia koreensis]|jgi:hypothetical protein|uniref:Sensory transduction regulator n=1 Tax=Ohtaekwangia koreensis TaxID=688867 RepID=A0A1T5MFE7_9BACT|nr:YbjN domain-containing protein [Ohtaekwangia koreensis]SKC86971.1 hypothetical protein SAMN05660236_5303 [Ohtaekwangia koreensis]